MRYDDFIALVQEETKLPAREDAERVAEATLETFGERLPRLEQEQLAAQLPKELKEFMLKRETTERYELQEFYNRVGARADTGYYDAAERAKGVMRALQEAVTPGNLEQAFDRLPDPFRDLLKTKPKGPGFPSL